MDLEEWEFLPNNGFLEIPENGNKNIIFGNFPSQLVESTTQQSRIPNQLVPVQLFQLHPSEEEDDEVVTKQVITENTKAPTLGTKMVEDEQDQVSQVFFKKETEFENMKLDSPKFSNKNPVSQIDTKSLQFEEKAEENMETESSNHIEENNNGLNLWNWSLTGIGAICSIGVAATICIFIGNHQNKKKMKQNMLNQKLIFQFSDDKTMKQVVHQQPTKLNEANSQVPITRKLTVEGLLISSLEHIQECLSVS